MNVIIARTIVSVPIGALILFHASLALAQARAEMFDYQVTWGHASVGKLTVQRGCPRDGYVPAALRAHSLGTVEQLHAFELRLDSFLGADGRPLEGWTRIEEKRKPRSFKTRFSQDSGAARVTKEFEKRETRLELAFRGTTHDLLSWWYTLRNEKLKENRVFEYHVWDGWKLVRMTASVGPLERVWTPVGTWDAHRVKLVRTRLHHAGSDAYTAKRTVETIGVLWLASGDGNIPVALDLEAPVGVAKVRLTRKGSRDCGD